MPDILIRVPDSIRCCGECPCFYAEHPMRCQADTHRPKRTHGAPYAGKPDWCPAKELPPHGDLISRDDLLHTMRCHLALYDSCPEDLSLADKSRRDEIQNAIADIFNIPAIVPAEKGETQ